MDIAKILKRLLQNSENGNLSDEVEIIHLALYSMTVGEVEQGLEAFRRIREHIAKAGEYSKSKSILPKIDAMIANLT